MAGKISHPPEQLSAKTFTLSAEELDAGFAGLDLRERLFEQSNLIYFPGTIDAFNEIELATVSELFDFTQPD